MPERKNRKNVLDAAVRQTFEALESRRMMSAGIRSYDGSGNNIANPTWGQTGTALLRAALSQYTDGLNSPAGPTRPGARDISNILMRQHPAEDIFNEEGMSAFAYAWGQFIDHDLDLTTTASPTQPFNVPVPTGDVFFDPDYTGTQVIGLNRSQVVPGTGITTPREQPNSVSAFLDGSMMYGSSLARSDALRTFKNGLLKTSDHGKQLPYNVDGLENQAAGPAANFFLSGDIRANENSELTSLHVLFLREHNRLAGTIQKQNPKWNDEQVFQQARRLVIGEIQKITYTEFLPSFLNMSSMPAYSGYKSNVNPQVATEFSTAAFRFGHSILGNDVQFFDDNCDTTLDDLTLEQTFFAPEQQLNGGTDGLLKYLAAVSAQESDQNMAATIRNFLFGPPGAGGFDLPALDVQRGRDHGLADYNTEREALGLARITDFSQISDNPSINLTLQHMYGSVDNIDLFVGGICEPHAPGAAIGETFQRIIADQFTRTRDGDRFWYQLDLSGADLKLVQGSTLSSIIKANTTIKNIQKNAFHFDITFSGSVFVDSNGNGKFDNSEQPIDSQSIFLFDSDGLSYPTVFSDGNGFYRINKIQVGTYNELIDVPDGWELTTPLPDNLVVTTDIQYQNQNFGMRPIPKFVRPRDTIIGPKLVATKPSLVAGLSLGDSVLGGLGIDDLLRA